MWNFFKRLFGGGERNQTQIVGAGSIAIQTGNSVDMIDIKTAETVSWGQARTGLSAVTEEAANLSAKVIPNDLRQSRQRTLEKLGGRVVSGPVDASIARRVLNNADLQRQWADTLRNPHGVQERDLGGTRNASTAEGDLFKKTQRNVDTIRADMLQRAKESSTFRATPYMTPVPRNKSANTDSIQRSQQQTAEDERRRRQRQQDDDFYLTQNQTGNYTGASSYYTPPEPSRYDCASTHHSHDAGHSNHIHSCPAHDHVTVDISTSSISNMD